MGNERVDEQGGRSVKQGKFKGREKEEVGVEEEKDEEEKEEKEEEEKNEGGGKLRKRRSFDRLLSLKKRLFFLKKSRWGEEVEGVGRRGRGGGEGKGGGGD